MEIVFGVDTRYVNELRKKQKNGMLIQARQGMKRPDYNLAARNSPFVFTAGSDQT